MYMVLLTHFEDTQAYMILIVWTKRVPVSARTTIHQSICAGNMALRGEDAPVRSPTSSGRPRPIGGPPQNELQSVSFQFPALGLNIPNPTDTNPVFPLS